MAVPRLGVARKYPTSSVSHYGVEVRESTDLPREETVRRVATAEKNQTFAKRIIQKEERKDAKTER